MVYLLDIETDLIQNLEKYKEELEHKVQLLNNLVQHLKEENLKYLNKREEYLHNPLNCFKLIRRLNQDWPQMEFFINQNEGKDFISAVYKYREELPTESDLQEASEAINRLQETYNLDINHLAQGMINGQQYDSKLESIDTFSMGYYLFKNKLYYSARFWFNCSIMDYKEHNYYKEILDFDKEKVLGSYVDTLLNLGSRQKALEHINQALAISPQNFYLRNRKIQIEHYNYFYEDKPIEAPISNHTDYQLGCQGYFKQKPSKLYCLYNTYASSFLRLAPIKMEIVNLEPYMILYHDVVSASEICYLINLAKSNLKRATVYYINDLSSSTDSCRTSKVFWFQNDTDQITKRLDQRIHDITGFDMTNSELFQIVNYGIGGHFAEHYDFFNATETNEVIGNRGDRLATILFYLTDVERGGATVFPNIKMSIFPRKGSALMWYNLNNKLEPDVLTLHAACPVLMGSKWICTKWIRSMDQMFIRPCYK
ncbi:prolyl 4-hydroxylase subunit alpha-1-like [Cochliomyia hominivorax]